MRFYTTEKLGPKQSTTPEGFLVCHDVAIARTGVQVYGAQELPVLEAAGNLIHVKRDADQVFRPETLASFEGKPVTITHPPEFVTPENWKELAVGSVQNVRQGAGMDADLVLADLVITDKAAIDLVRGGMREVSCGYDAEYQQEAPGVGRQLNIVGNHVALVERGRAGPRCSIQDGDFDIMATAKKQTLIQRLLRVAFKSQDAATFDAAVEAMDGDDEDEGEDEGKGKKAKTGDAALADQLAALVKTVDGLSKTVAKLSKTKDGDDDMPTEDEDEDDEGKKKKTDDDGEDLTDPAAAGKADTGTTYTGDELKAIVSKAEILAPGFSMPTGDAMKTADAVVGLMRRILTQASKTEDGAKRLAPLLGGRTVDKLTVDQVPFVFNAAAEMARATNNAKGIRHNVTTKDFGRANNIQSINQANKDFWAKRSAT